MSGKTYIAIDLKSFYASVECQELGQDPLTTHLVVADKSRTEKTICLAVSPALKAYGVPGRARLWEVVEAVERINARRLQNAPGHRFTGSSSDAGELARDPSLALDYVVATPRMAYYMDYSTRIYGIYLNYVSPEDIHVYSIDEVFIDATPYLRSGRCTAHDFAMRMIRDVLQTTGITATAGIAPNLYLCKVAMDIWAKRFPADKDGVRIAELDELKYRQYLWAHRPLTDFWRVGHGIARKLEQRGIFTMGDIARCSLQNEDLLYRLFGVNAELLIDHAWGWEPCELRHIKAYRPESNSLSMGQVLSEPYSYEKAQIIVREMAEGMALDLVEKGLVTDQLVLSVGYDRASLNSGYRGEVCADWYGRRVPKPAHGSQNLGRYTASTRLLTEAALEILARTVDPSLLVRRVTLAVTRVLPAASAPEQPGGPAQMDLFSDGAAEREETALAREQRLQEAMLRIKHQYGKNAILHGASYREGATGRERNGQIGGHRA